MLGTMFDNAKAVLRPQAVIVHRNDPVHDPDAYPQVSQRYEVGVRVQPAPMPVPDTAFAAVGRGPESRTPHQWRYTSLSIPEWLMARGGWPFSVPKVPSALVVGMPNGRFIPAATRVNIDAPQPRSLGSQTTLSTIPTTAANLLKITL